MNKTVSTPHKCPVCKKYEFPFQNSYEICEICGWIDSSYQDHNPNEDCLVNTLSLEEARAAYNNGEEIW